MDYSHFPVGIAVRALLYGRNFAKFEDLGVVHVGDQALRFFAELVDLLRLSQVLNKRFIMLVVLELLDQPLLRSRVLCSAARLQKEVLQLFCDPRCCYRFPLNSSNRQMGPKMTLRLGFVDLVDQIASSILARHVALLDLSEPFGRAHP